MQPGKLRGLDRLADANGHLCMLAIDQRPPLLDLVRRTLPDLAGNDVAARRALAGEVVALKSLVVEELQAHAGAVLIDPWVALGLYGDIDPRRGLLLTLEHHRFDARRDGRRSTCIPDWSVERIARAGADAVKLLAWYRPDAPLDVRHHQERFVEAVGAACLEHDVPFVFELLLYPLAADDEPRRSEAVPVTEDPQLRRRLVLESVERFADPRFAVDVFKVESPVPAAALPDPSDDDGTCAAAFVELDRLVDRPWVLLSGGHDRTSFRRAVRYACAAGASGFLAGRSIWWDAVSRHPDVAAVRAQLRSDAAPFLDEMSALVHDNARPWRDQARCLGPAVVHGLPEGGPPQW